MTLTQLAERTSLRALSAFSALVLCGSLGCSSGDATPAPADGTDTGGSADDSATDVATDAPTDAVDARADSTLEAPGDAGADTAGDAPSDSSAIDAPADTTVDAPLDTASDAPSDTVDKPCVAGGKECGAGTYCDAPTCGAGTCKVTPASSSTYAPVCGCDGVTYWNADHAASMGASTKSGSGVCTGTTVACGGFAARPCPSPKTQTCIYDLTGFGTCSVADVGGTCWSIPAGASCPGAGLTQYHTCPASSGCVDQCNALKSGKSFYRDLTCPT